MDINRLNQEELEYEMEVRGLALGKVEVMRKSLRAAKKLENNRGSSFTAPPSPFDFASDEKALTAKLEEVKKLVSSATSTGTDAENRKISTKVEWALGRLNRVDSKGNSVSEARKSELRSEFVATLGELLERGTQTDSDESLEEVGFTTSTPVRNSKIGGISSIEKWNLKFSGDSHQFSVNSFLERVKELCEARNVSKNQIFRSALDLFSGKALVWYRAIKDSVHNWEELEVEIKAEFLPPGYDDKLMDEIKRRTQGNTETIGVYVATMKGLFRRLTEQLPEEKQLKILRERISPFYQSSLGLQSVPTINELVRLGRLLEATRASIDTFVPPQARRVGSHLEPDLAFVDYQPEIALNALPATGDHNQERVYSGQPANIVCYNCKAPGHRSNVCPAPRRCFGCGTVGTVFAKCFRCSSMKGNGGGTQNARD